MRRVLMGIAVLAAVCAVTVRAEDKVLATVGNEKITEKDLEDNIKQFRMMFPQAPPTLNPEQKRMILDQMVLHKTLFTAAMDAGTKLDTEAEFQLDMMRKTFTIKLFIDKQLAAVPVKDAEIKAYYDKNTMQFTIPETRKLRHIVVKTQQEADKIAQQLKAKKSFNKLASDSNIDGTKGKSGDLGWMEKGMMGPEFDAAAFTLKKGSVSPVVKTPFGYHVIKVEDVKEGKERTLDEVKEDIRKALEEEKVRKIIEDQKVKYGVKVNEELLNPPPPPPAPAKDEKK